jgi:hypothetical protein
VIRPEALLRARLIRLIRDQRRAAGRLVPALETQQAYGDQPEQSANDHDQQSGREKPVEFLGKCLWGFLHGSL